MMIEEDTKQRIDAREAKGRGGFPLGFNEEGGKGERRSGGNEESIGGSEVGGE